MWISVLVNQNNFKCSAHYYRESICSFLNNHWLHHFLTRSVYNPSHFRWVCTLIRFMHYYLNCVSHLVWCICHNCVDCSVLATPSSISAVFAPFVSFLYLYSTTDRCKQNIFIHKQCNLIPCYRNVIVAYPNARHLWVLKTFLIIQCILCN